ncbi:hypothetical protein C9890_0069, partial [Perkinsus sp. BL_2016]
MAAGLIADVVSAPLWTPAEVVSTRLQLQGPGVVAYANTRDAVRRIYATEGVRGFFRGLNASIVAFGPASAIWWGTYGAAHRGLM